MNKLLLGTVSYLALAGLASAADMVVKAPPRAAVPAASWAGCYIGVHGAIVANRDRYDGFDGEANEDVSGTFKKTVGGVGGQIGCNWQNQNVVYGIEGDGTWASAKSAIIGVNDEDYTYNSQARWLATLRGRIGITAGSGGQTLLYVTGGLALGGVKDGVQDVFAPGPEVLASKTLFGWTAGFGVEQMLTRNWTIKAEALFVGLADHNTSLSTTTSCGTPCGPYNIRHSHDFFVGKVGLNYKF